MRCSNLYDHRAPFGTIWLLAICFFSIVSFHAQATNATDSAIVRCKDNNGNVVADSLCDPGARPADTRVGQVCADTTPTCVAGWGPEVILYNEDTPQGAATDRNSMGDCTSGEGGHTASTRNHVDECWTRTDPGAWNVYGRRCRTTTTTTVLNCNNQSINVPADGSSVSTQCYIRPVAHNCYSEVCERLEIFAKNVNGTPVCYTHGHNQNTVTSCSVQSFATCTDVPTESNCPGTRGDGG